MENLDLLKHSLYIDGAYEDDYLAYLLTVAKDTVMRALDHEEEPNTPIFQHCLILLAVHLYENRVQGVESALNNIPFGVHSFIQQLRGEYNGQN